MIAKTTEGRRARGMLYRIGGGHRAHRRKATNSAASTAVRGRPATRSRLREGADHTPRAVFPFHLSHDELHSPAGAGSTAARGVRLRYQGRLSPAERGRDVAEDRLDHVRIVFDAEGVGHGEKQGISLGDGLVPSQLFDQ